MTTFYCLDFETPQPAFQLCFRIFHYKEKKSETLIDASKEVGLEINVEKTKYMLLSRDIKIANRSFENVSQFKYLGTTVTTKSFIQEEIKRRLNSGNASYHSGPEPSVFSVAVEKHKN
jgi:hypothetical protein